MTVVGLAQIRPEIDYPELSVERIDHALQLAATRNIEVLVFPELANSGYAFRGREEARAQAEEIPNGRVSNILKKWSRGGRLVVAGLCEAAPDGLYNSAAVFADGRHLTTYRKVHLFDREKEIFIAGDAEPPVVEFKGRRYGVMICFDWIFPEMARILALKGADMILHPANLVLPYCQRAMRIRSIENRIFTATANRVGTERDLTFTGASQITSPAGEILLKLPVDSEAIRWIDVDLSEARQKMVTERNHVIDDRRPEIYRRLV